VALQTAASLITLLTAFLIFDRLRRNSRLDELALVAAVLVIALSNVLFVMECRACSASLPDPKPRKGIHEPFPT
jgi:hypothetical protein